jgi:hypothetical protein
VEIDIQDIPLHDGLNLLGSICVFKCVASVFERRPCWADISDHHCSTIAAKTVFEQSGKFAVSVRYMLLRVPGLLIVTKSIYTVAE